VVVEGPVPSGAVGVIGRIVAVAVAVVLASWVIPMCIDAARDRSSVGSSAAMLAWSLAAVAPLATAIVAVAMRSRQGWRRTILPAAISSAAVSLIVIIVGVILMLQDL